MLGNQHKAACYAEVLFELVVAAEVVPPMQVRMGKAVEVILRGWGDGVGNQRWDDAGAKDLHSP